MISPGDYGRILAVFVALGAVVLLVELVFKVRTRWLRRRYEAHLDRWNAEGKDRE